MVSRDAVLVGVAVAGLGAIATGAAEGLSLPQRAAGSAQNATPDPNTGPADPDPDPQPTEQSASDAASQAAQTVTESTSVDVPSAKDIGTAATTAPDEGGPVGGHADPQGGLAATMGRDRQESRRGSRVPGTTTTVGTVDAVDTGKDKEQSSGPADPQPTGSPSGPATRGRGTAGPLDPGDGRPSHPF